MVSNIDTALAEPEGTITYMDCSFSREEAIEAPPTNVTVPPGAAAVLSCRTHLALHGHMSWVRIYPETGRVEELANSTEVYREVYSCRLRTCQWS